LAPQPAKAVEPAKRLSYKDQRELEQLPALIERLETRLTQLHFEGAQPEFYRLPGETIAAKRTEEQTLAAQLAVAFARWEQLEGGRPA
jgi:ATP-binding cassette subfamily F protein uup